MIQRILGAVLFAAGLYALYRFGLPIFTDWHSGPLTSRLLNCLITIIPVSWMVSGTWAVTAGLH